MHLLEDCWLQGAKFQAWNWEMYRKQFSQSALVGSKEGLTWMLLQW